jgi:hypothetical protein
VNLKQFAAKTKILSATEIQKVRLLAYFFLRTSELAQFTTTDVSSWFNQLDLATPNPTRLRENLQKSRTFIRGGLANTFRLHAKEISTLDQEYPHLVEKSEDIVAADEVLPEALFARTRGFIESLSRQINACYEHNAFDGCAVLMRRLVEVLLILSYQANGIESKIKDSSGDYKQLVKIIGDAVSNPTLDLSKNTKACLDTFRELGNFSAHQIYYNAKRKDVQKEILGFRAAVEELLYKAGIKT